MTTIPVASTSWEATSFHDSPESQADFEKIFDTRFRLKCKPLGECTSVKGEQNIMGVLVRCQHYKETNKRTGGKASHDYSVTFHIVDPSRPDPNHSIPVVWFFNGVKDHGSAAAPAKTCRMQDLLEASAGDVVMLLSVKIGEFNGNPQITGTFDKSGLLLFHNQHDYKSGTLLNRKKCEAAGGIHVSADVLHGEDWETSVLCSENVKMSSDATSNITVTEAAKALGFWSENWLKSIKLCHGDEGMLTTFDAVYTTATNPLSTLPTFSNIPSSASSNGIPEIGAVTVTLCCLVLKKMEGSMAQNSKFYAWDGTSFGCMTSSILSLQPSISRQELDGYCATIDSIVSVACPHRKCSPQDLAKLRKQDSFRDLLLGSILSFEANTVMLNPCINKLKEGHLVEVRNAVFDVAAKKLLIKQETVIIHIPLIAKDAVDLADRFVDNLLKTPPPRAVVVAHQTSTPMTTTMPVNSSIRATITISDPMDRDVMGLLDVCYVNAPAVVMTKGILISWYPTIERFVRVSNGKLEFFFTLRFNDGGFMLDVLFQGEDAEEFVGVTAKEFRDNSDVQLKLQQELNKLISNKIILKLLLKVFSTKNKKRDKSGQVKSNIKRIGIFHCKGPFSIR